ncbi:class I SAM-dependent methyltransferase [Roseospira navarrensis]|uniref:Methyltransferase domain-containing protein n=1 Tax=Roseospira navarrensis TaxID=140058 RepID=A0A7X1ZER2_9PROT|nr:class I SAM-dependent methyltransferase [Roseospira navarrensis]MQX36062.1 methyltransferase domain-containing protein [Roseospira navarrensis]
MTDMPLIPETLSRGLPVKGSRAMMREVLAPIEGLRIADLGCGDGTWVRFLTGEGATVVGCDPNPRQLDKAKATPPVGGERYVSAGAEAVPLDAGSQDVALFFNSLHHVPEHLMAPAVAEAARITRPGGRVVAFEPVARGANYELGKPVDDEIQVRALAHRALHDAARAEDIPLSLDREFEYVTVSKKRDFETWREQQVRISPGRAATFEADEAGLRGHFEQVLSDLPRDEDGTILLDQPMRCTILLRT